MVTVNISFQDDLLSSIDQVAKNESRTRSELLREAARMYIERKGRWEMIFAHGDQQAKKNKLKEKDVMQEIRAYRRRKSTT